MAEGLPVAEGDGKHHGIVDEWGDLSAMIDAAAAETMQRLEEEERVVGIKPPSGWRATAPRVGS